ncbi:YeeE/YedE family protein [Glaciecola petra]|uniref:YeeE/YedE thiosulfate transporter family protein n=1 Tax=Glaciecola petra TaxID=3075602 RepID=A0ABU2ZUF1_9ALTE|nr:YeeE/YedE thiosulfate transporter family protein [Aestuariibacter sp. P117]MDT0596267.1 YeeE/YedE thiosulfate transporter family protein [Aestuariibacter sp. P117]
MNFIDSLIGGAILGASSLLLLIATGRIAGISGIIGNMLTRGANNGWRLMFLIGLALGPLLAAPSGYILPEIDASWWMIIIGGLLVGFGSAYGSGCTSGHGICGMGRLSARSMTAVVTFMVVAAVTVFVIRHIVGGA